MVGQTLPQLMMAVMAPEGISACTKRGFHIQTTPLAGEHELLVNQVQGHKNAKDEMGDAGDHLTISLSRVAFLAHSPAEHRARVEAAHAYYSRFDNIYTGPGLVDAGMIRPLPRAQTIEELEASLLVCTPDEMVERLAVYDELGIDRVILNPNFGVAQSATLEMIECFAEEVMPQFAAQTA